MKDKHVLSTYQIIGLVLSVFFAGMVAILLAAWIYSYTNSVDISASQTTTSDDIDIFAATNRMMESYCKNGASRLTDLSNLASALMIHLDDGQSEASYAYDMMLIHGRIAKILKINGELSESGRHVEFAKIYSATAFENAFQSEEEIFSYIADVDAKFCSGIDRDR
jgi:pyruvate-formate lyase